MAELRIQPKKSAPSPWLLVALALLVLAGAAYFFLRADPADEPAAPAATAPTAPAPGPPPSRTTTDSVAAAGPPAAKAAAPTDSARATLLELSPALTQLADRADLRDDAAIREQRDNFTSATARLAEGDPQASLRPGFVAAANLLLAVQQKAYPTLETSADDLVQQASQLSGRAATPAERAQNQQYLAKLAALLEAVRAPADPQP